eukprot:CAMPEP_0180250632 /NCGR_PEP_ID=MMETSP0987-20121128/37988_1 /TAXON_ID=697907 /ORGANISM="non described non described, Strain CCMP2293" /LENGTH=33 /DNA_ID= /DNA_START= /DNA_END= /DNA_ORIENTATION=
MSVLRLKLVSDLGWELSLRQRVQDILDQKSLFR